MDTNNQLLRRINLTSGIVTSVAGLSGNTGFVGGVATNARFKFPAGIAIAASGAFALIVSVHIQLRVK